jgi:hypothetical protein
MSAAPNCAECTGRTEEHGNEVRRRDGHHPDNEAAHPVSSRGYIRRSACVSHLAAAWTTKRPGPCVCTAREVCGDIRVPAKRWGSLTVEPHLAVVGWLGQDGTGAVDNVHRSGGVCGPAGLSSAGLGS